MLRAKLGVFAILGLGYGLVSSLSSGLALLLGTAIHGEELGLPAGQLVTMLVQLTLASAVYMVLGVGIGALARHQLLAVGIVLGYFYFLEYVLMLIPGINRLYPILPGGATASLTRFTFLTEAIEQQTGTAAALGSPVMGALILLGYAALAAAVAVLVPLRRDLG